MAGLLNPQYGLAPGAPYGLHQWLGNQFVLADFPPPPAAPASPPAPPMAATITPQDVQAMQATQALSSGGADSGGAQGGATRDQQGPNAGNPFSGFGPAVSGFANSFGSSAGATPANFNSNYGVLGSTLGGAAGALSGTPGIGMGLGAIGQGIDANRYAGVLNANNVPMSPNYFSAALAGLTSTPFGNLLGTSARQQAENARRDTRALKGPIPGNVGDLVSGPTAAFDPREQGGYDTQNNAQGWGLADRAAADMAAAGMGPGWGGTGGPAPGGDFGVSPGPGMDAGGFGPGAGAGPDIGGAFGPGFAEGGVVRTPRRSDPPARSLSRDPATGALVTPEEMSAIGLDLRSGRLRDEENYQANRGAFDPGRALYQLLTALRPSGPGVAPGMYDPGPAPVFADHYAKGGNVTKQTMGLLGQIDPPGPDDQVAGLQSGEGVLTRAAMKRHPGLLHALNKGDIKRARGLLNR